MFPGVADPRQHSSRPPSCGKTISSLTRLQHLQDEDLRQPRFVARRFPASFHNQHPIKGDGAKWSTRHQRGASLAADACLFVYLRGRIMAAWAVHRYLRTTILCADDCSQRWEVSDRPAASRGEGDMLERFDLQALFDVRGRTAAITGGSGHFGRAMAAAL